MKYLLIEIVIGVVLFTLIAIPLALKDPLGSIGDYPPAIRKKCVELGLIEERERRFSSSELLRKGAAMIVLTAVFAYILKRFNGADTFMKGFLDSYVIWLVITWFDALVIDCLWFCHSKKVRIPGTEDMKEYQDYLFHIRQSLIGTLLGIPVCALVGLMVMI